MQNNYLLSAGLTLLALALTLGCHGREVAHAEHHDPEHKPKDFPAAVDRLFVLHTEIVNESEKSPNEIDRFTEAYDIARWLPEIAADSPLGRQPWDRVNECALALRSILGKIQAKQSDGRRMLYLQKAAEVERRYQQLLEIKTTHFNATAHEESES